MKSSHKQTTHLNLKQVQWIAWILLYGINVVIQTSYTTVLNAFVYPVVLVLSYSAIIYGNAGLLIPKFYAKRKYVQYVLSALLLLTLVGAFRYVFNVTVYKYLAQVQGMPVRNEPFQLKDLVGMIGGSFFIYIASILFYVTLNYFKLREKQEAIQKRQIEVELNLLKAQVQPHFLFNTLNNIYSVAQRESPTTAEMLEKLSGIMRYFIDEATKDRIQLADEMKFVRSYIDLEKMRMRFPLKVDILSAGIPESLIVPPMLLIPLVENVFKHGIDKRREDNFIFIQISIVEQQLQVTVRNRLVQSEGEKKNGTGLANLRNRLQLLYGEKYSLATTTTTEFYTSVLSLPL